MESATAAFPLTVMGYAGCIEFSEKGSQPVHTAAAFPAVLGHPC